MKLKALPTHKKESTIEAYLVQEVRKLGGKAYKFTSPSQRGVPDRIVIFRNCMPIFVELKAEGGKLSKLQEVEIAYLLEMGQNVCVCVGKNGVNELLRTIKEIQTNDKPGSI